MLGELLLMVSDGCMACGYCWGLVPTHDRIFSIKRLFREPRQDLT